MAVCSLEGGLQPVNFYACNFIGKLSYHDFEGVTVREEEAERLLGLMDDIYGVLVSMDYPDAITSGLRRQTDVARSIIEKTRGDITFSLRGEHLEQAIGKLIGQLNGDQPEVGKEAGKFIEQEDE